MFHKLKPIYFILLLAVLDIFFSSLIFPLNLIVIVNVGLILMLLLKNYGDAFLCALGIGILQDYMDGTPLGMSSLMYIIALTVVFVMQKSILTHQNYLSALLIFLAFNLIYFSAVMFTEFRMNILILGQLFLAVVINGFFSLAAFLLYHYFKGQLGRHFLSK